MGRKKVIKEIHARALLAIILGGILFLGAGFFTFCFLIVGGIGEEIGLVIFLGISTCFGLLILILGITQWNPNNSQFFKRNPELFKQVDELFSNIVYEDDFIICSNKTLANKKHLLNIAQFDEILGIHESIHTYNSILTLERHLVLVTKKGQIKINIYARKQDTVENLIQQISELAPNARIGWSTENNAYYNKVQTDYKNRRKIFNQ
jgi:hypothetical protein